MAKTPLLNDGQTVKASGDQLALPGVPSPPRVNLSGIAQERQRPTRPIEPYQRAAEYEARAAQAVGALGDQLAAFAMRMGEIENAKHVSEGVNQMYLAIADAEDAIRSNPNESEWRGQFRDIVGGRVAEITEQLAMSPMARDEFRLRADRMLARGEAAIAGEARALTQRKLSDALDLREFMAIQHGDEGELVDIRNARVANGLDTPAGAEISFMRGQQAIRGVNAEKRMAAVRALIAVDPDAAQAELDSVAVAETTVQASKFGYPNDSTPDDYSYRVAKPGDPYAEKYGIPIGESYGIGDHDNLLRPGSVALSPDVIKELGLPSKSDGRLVEIERPNGQILVGTWDNKTAAEWPKGSGNRMRRVDFYVPDGKLSFDGEDVKVRVAEFGMDSQSRRLLQREIDAARAQRKVGEAEELLDRVYGGKITNTQAFMTALDTLRWNRSDTDRHQLLQAFQQITGEMEAMAPRPLPTAANVMAVRNMIAEWVYDPRDPASIERGAEIERAIAEVSQAPGLVDEVNELRDWVKAKRGGAKTGLDEIQSTIKPLADSMMEAGEFGPPLEEVVTGKSWFGLLDKTVEIANSETLRRRAIFESEMRKGLELLIAQDPYALYDEDALAKVKAYAKAAATTEMPPIESNPLLPPLPEDPGGGIPNTPTGSPW